VLAKVAETLLKRDRIIVIAGLAAVTALAWVYVLQSASSMTGMDINNMEMSMPHAQA